MMAENSKTAHTPTPWTATTLNCHAELVEIVQRFIALFAYQISNTPHDASGHGLVADARAILAKVEAQ